MGSGETVRSREGVVIARKYGKVQKGIGDIMREPMIETEAHRILARGISENKQQIAQRMLRAGKYMLEEIAEISGLSEEEIKEMKGGE